MAHPYRFLTEKALDFWLARGAVLTIVILQIIIVNDLSVGPRWLAPVLELALLIPLSIATVWTQRRARKASTDAQWNLVGRQRLMMRRLALSLTALVTLVNFGALARLVEAILAGNAGSGRTLLLDALNIWATNVIIFALWFWALDRGSPARRERRQTSATTFSSPSSNRPATHACTPAGHQASSTTCFSLSPMRRRFHPPTHFHSPCGPSS
jgi:hypothetical protein